MEKGVIQRMYELTKSIVQLGKDNPELMESILGMSIFKEANEIIEQHEEIIKKSN